MEKSREKVWEDFARENAEYYVLTDRRDYEHPDARAWFFESGRREFGAILSAASAWLNARDLAVEIGCGVGRLTIPAARAFGRVRAVDVSPTMLAKLAANCEQEGVTNVEPFLADDRWDAGARPDLVFSRYVFQHIEDFAVIERCVERIAACLGTVGVACLQFDTRPRTVAYGVRNRLPDRLLPRNRRRGIRRIRRERGALLDLFAAYRLAVVEERGADTEDDVFVLVPGADVSGEARRGAPGTAR